MSDRDPSSIARPELSAVLGPADAAGRWPCPSPRHPRGSHEPSVLAGVATSTWRCVTCGDGGRARDLALLLAAGDVGRSRRMVAVAVAPDAAASERSVPLELVRAVPLDGGGPALARPVGGPVDVVDQSGAAADIERAKALELVVWLAHHRSQPSRLNARTALWHTDVRDATFLNVVSDARRALARLVPPPPGEEWIGRAGGDRLPLHPLVVTDADLLAAHVSRASGQRPAEAAITLRAGLELVRGVPLGGVAYLWPDGEGLPSTLTHLVTSAATACILPPPGLAFGLGASGALAACGVGEV